MNINITLDPATATPLDSVVLRALADSLEGGSATQLKTAARTPRKQQTDSTTEQPAASEAEQLKTEVPAVTEGSTLSLESLRAFAQEKSIAGKREHLKTILTSFGAKNLTDLKPEHYDAFYAQLQAA